MARKIFVTYKYSDSTVQPINGGTTARAYVDELINLFEGEEIYKGEEEEDLSDFKDETIASHLRDKIYDSSMTLVLISPKMKDEKEDESEQWIPLEISYSLKEISRKERTSHTNAMLAVVLPDNNNSYEYFIKDNSCKSCGCRQFKTWTLFQILKLNMFNVKKPVYSDDCEHHEKNSVYTGEHSYILSVKWSHFISTKETYLKRAEDIRKKIEDYNITKTISI